ncbi:MAG: Hsp70 family protein, partial [Deltaproteobacteria bacterium]|nr:Hsp70 family protein [Deltaproteobacteria bacterium]
MIGVGLDFGTTNSTIAVFDGQKVSYLEIDPLSLTPSVMTSALYFDRSFSTTIGAGAIQKYLSENEGRRVRLVKEVLGEVKVSYG